MLEERINGHGPALRLTPWTFIAYNHSSYFGPNGAAAAAAVDDYRWNRILDALSNDYFRMFEFKVRMCTSAKSHDWTECPFAHPGEKARRRDPMRFRYSGAVCPDFRNGTCRRGSACEFAHGVFECWLHPARYRTQLCKDGEKCKRRICFFAHSPYQLRRWAGGLHHHRISGMELRELDSSSHASPTISQQLNVHEGKSMASYWIAGDSCSSPRRFGTRPTLMGTRYFEGWNVHKMLHVDQEDTERVESGKDLRARMFEKLSLENPLSREPEPNPDVS